MKCTLEIYGKRYESTEFTERQVTLYIAAACGMTGINIRDLFQSLINFKGLEGKGFRDYDSTESAERDLAYLLKKVFPTLDRHVDSIDTAELIEIVTPMLKALVASNAEPSEDPAATPKGTEVRRSEVLRTLGYRDEPTPTEKEPSDPPDNVWGTEIIKIKTMEDVESFGWEYPPGETLLLSPQEEDAIGYACQVSGAEPAKVRCWYAWWQAVNDGESVTPAVAIEVLRQFTKQFTEEECGRYYALFTAHLEKLAPIAV